MHVLRVWEGWGGGCSHAEIDGIPHVVSDNLRIRMGLMHRIGYNISAEIGHPVVCKVFVDYLTHDCILEQW